MTDTMTASTHLIEFNLLGPMLLLHTFIPMLKLFHARVIFIGSSLGQMPSSMIPSYSTAKHGLQGWCLSMRHELQGSHGNASVSLVQAPISCASCYEESYRMRDLPKGTNAVIKSIQHAVMSTHPCAVYYPNATSMFEAALSSLPKELSLLRKTYEVYRLK